MGPQRVVFGQSIGPSMRNSRTALRDGLECNLPDRGIALFNVYLETRNTLGSSGCGPAPSRGITDIQDERV